MDPFLREMHLGIGCAIENAMLAAGTNGFAVEFEATPGRVTGIARGKPAHAATLYLRKTAPTRPDPLYEAIPHRHTNRYPYTRGTGLSQAWLDFARRDTNDVRLVLFTDGARRAQFDAAVIDATKAIVADPKMEADSDRWLRVTDREIEKHRDGVTLRTAGLSAMTLFLAQLFPSLARGSGQAWIDMTRNEQLPSVPVTGLIAVRDRYDREQALAAGRRWQRLHLAATLRGVALQPLNQAIEMVDREKERGRRRTWLTRVAALTDAGWEATFAFRAGMLRENAPASPRRALKDVVMT